MPAFPAYPMLTNPPPRQREAGVTRTPMEGGMVKQRKRFSRVLIGRPVTYLLKTAVDYDNFITFYETTINRVDWFDWTDPADGVVKQARIVGGKLDKEEPQRKDHGLWKVSFVVETWSS